MEYTFKKKIDMPVEIDFGKLLKIIKRRKPAIENRELYNEFMDDAGYYISQLIGYDPYELYCDVDEVVEVIIYDFGAYLDEQGIN